jgi:hypothetical protein
LSALAPFTVSRALSSVNTCRQIRTQSTHRRDAETIANPPDQHDAGEDGQGRYLTLEAIDRDLERLGELTGPYVTDTKDDLSVAAARIPDLDGRHEAEELLRRLRPVIESHLEAINRAVSDRDDQHPAEEPPSP